MTMMPLMSRPSSQLVTMYAPDPHTWDSAPVWSVSQHVPWTIHHEKRRRRHSSVARRPGSVCLSDKYNMSETGSHSGGWRRERSRTKQNNRSNKTHVSNLEIEIRDHQLPVASSVQEAQVSFENVEEEEGRERRRMRSGTSTSLSEKYSLNTSSETKHNNIGELTVTDFAVFK